MNLWDVFKMEFYKNIHDRKNVFLLIFLGVLNVIGMSSVAIISNNAMNGYWYDIGSFGNVGRLLSMIGMFSIATSFIFLFFYPYQLACVDYKNNVMSSIIASGVSRVQYYFVKVGATLVSAFISYVFLIIVPIIISHAIVDWEIFAFSMDDFLQLSLYWISTFSILMTSVILTRGRSMAPYVFVGLFIVNFIILDYLYGIFFQNAWEATGGSWNTIRIIQQFITVIVFNAIGILTLRKQDL